KNAEVDMTISVIRISDPTNNLAGCRTIEPESVVHLVQEHMPIGLKTMVEIIQLTGQEIPIHLGILDPMRRSGVEAPSVWGESVRSHHIHLLLLAVDLYGLLRNTTIDLILPFETKLLLHTDP